MQEFNLLKNFRQENKIFRQRLLLAIFVLIVLVALLVARLIYLQIYHHKYYVELAQKEQTQRIPIEPNRGLIYDRNGVLLAENLPSFTLAIIPDQVDDIDNTIAELQKIIDISQDNIDQFYKSLEQHQHFDHVPLRFKLSEQELATFYSNQFRFSGVVVDSSMIRHYPLADSMVSVLGYVGRINVQDLKSVNNENYHATNFIGKIGIEKYYERQLHGIEGYREDQVDATGHIVHNNKTVPPVDGAKIYLTIDSKLQKVAEDALGDEAGAVVAIDPKNGEVLALVSNPGFDPNLFANGIDADTFQDLQNSPNKPMYNRAIRGHFPFASTIKPFIALQLLDTGTVAPTDTVYDPGYFMLPNSKHKFHNWIRKGQGTNNISQAIMVSNDTYFWTEGLKLGIAGIDNILNRFGFGQKTGVDLTEELPGIVWSPEWEMGHAGRRWMPSDTVNAVFGQGAMTATPLQLAAGVAAISQHGIRFKPHLLLKAELANGKEYIKKPELLDLVNLKNKKNWDIVINAMQDVVRNPKGTAHGRFSVNLKYTIAAKTGHAQVYHHHYNEKNLNEDADLHVAKILQDHTLFIGFAPAENPKIAIAIVVEHSNAALRVARTILDYYLAPPKPVPPEPKDQAQATVPPKAKEKEDDDDYAAKDSQSEQDADDNDDDQDQDSASNADDDSDDMNSNSTN